MTCERLGTEKSKRLATQADLSQPPLFPSSTEAERMKELSQVGGEIKAIKTVQLKKNCPASAKKR